MDHHHHQDHDQRREAARSGRAESRARLSLTLGLTLLYMVAEVVGGYLAGSLSLLADAGHMLSDAAALGLSLFASWIAQRPPTPQHSYGYYRAEILAALANGATLIAIAIIVFVEAGHRLSAPEPVQGPLLLGVAAGGLVINLLGLWILNAGKDESLNIHGAWLHVMTDALGSLAALSAGALVWGWGWNWADPVASILIGILVIFSSWNLVKQAIAVLMESTPRHLDVDAVRSAIMSTPGVCEVHDLHIWAITSGMESLSAHVALLPGYEALASLDSLRLMLRERFGIDHITIQIEAAGQEQCPTSF
jgi:cobalt-zinc-cadmium efflux system protein